VDTVSTHSVWTQSKHTSVDTVSTHSVWTQSKHSVDTVLTQCGHSLNTLVWTQS